MTNPLPEHAERWPSAEWAYDFVLPSYQFLLTRFEAADGRLTAIIGMISAVALGAPTVAKGLNPQITFASPYFVIGQAIFVVAMWYGILQRTKGVVVLPDPMILHQKCLGLPELQFKAEQLFLAGKHFDRNAKEIERKGTAANRLTIALFLEVIALIAWVIAL